MWRPCAKCGRSFSAESFAKQCLVCWKKERGFAMGKTDAALDGALTRIGELEAALEETRQQLGEARLAHAAELEPIPANLVKTLLSLCHPDRHGGSAKATEATKWLLQQRRKGGA